MLLMVMLLVMKQRLPWRHECHENAGKDVSGDSDDSGADVVAVDDSNTVVLCCCCCLTFSRVHVAKSRPNSNFGS